MKRIINTLEKMPKWYGFLTILLYSLLLAEFLITTNHLVNNNNLETDRLFVILARMSYIIIVLSAIVIWLISTFLFHLTAILFNGYAPFKHLLYISSYFYIIPAISVFISIFLHYSYLQPIINQYFVNNKSEIWLWSLMIHSKGHRFNGFINS